MSDLVERYQTGDREAVWRDLVELGPDVADPRWNDEAIEVARLTMTRVAQNVETIIGRLNDMGFRFATPHISNRHRREAIANDTPENREFLNSLVSDPAVLDLFRTSLEGLRDQPILDEYVLEWSPPNGEVSDDLVRAEHAAGPLPLSVHALLRDVGSFYLSGSFPNWDPSAYLFAEYDEDPTWPAFGVYTDALSCSGIAAITGYINDSTGRIGDGYIFDGRFHMALGPDALAGAGFSGGSHTVYLPQETADPVLVGVSNRPGIRLVEYLRVGFEWGGFPGFEFAGSVPDQIDQLRAGLLPI